MNTGNLKPAVAFWIGLVLSFPTFYFILVSLLKYVFGMPALFDAIAPSMERWGAKEPLGFNINALILFGPLMALLLNLLVAFHIHLHNQQDQWQVELLAQKSWGNWFIIFFSSLLLITLFVYAIGENCQCVLYQLKTIKNENNVVQTFWPYLFTHTFHGVDYYFTSFYSFNPYLCGYCLQWSFGK